MGCLILAQVKIVLTEVSTILITYYAVVTSPVALEAVTRARLGGGQPQLMGTLSRCGRTKEEGFVKSSLAQLYVPIFQYILQTILL